MMGPIGAPGAVTLGAEDFAALEARVPARPSSKDAASAQKANPRA